MRRSERTSAGRLGGGEGARETPSLFQFRLVDRLQCQQSGTVKYASQAADNLLSLQVRVCSLPGAHESQRLVCVYSVVVVGGGAVGR